MSDQESSRLTRIFVESPTRILRGLFVLAPRRRRSKVRWVVALGLVATLGGLGADRSTREYASSRARAYLRTEPAPIPAASAPAAATVAWPSVAVARSASGGT